MNEDNNKNIIKRLFSNPIVVTLTIITILVIIVGGVMSIGPKEITEEQIKRGEEIAEEIAEIKDGKKVEKKTEIVNDLRTAYKSLSVSDRDDMLSTWIMNYQGTDETGPTFSQVMDVLLDNTYTDQQLNHPKTNMYFLNTPTVIANNYLEKRYIDMQLYLDIAGDKNEFIWTIDLEEEIVFGNDQFSNTLLEILEE